MVLLLGDSRFNSVRREITLFIIIIQVQSLQSIMYVSNIFVLLFEVSRNVLSLHPCLGKAGLNKFINGGFVPQTVKHYGN
jgi:hypothetical protein